MIAEGGRLSAKRVSRSASQKSCGLKNSVSELLVKRVVCSCSCVDRASRKSQGLVGQRFGTRAVVTFFFLALVESHTAATF